MARAPRVVPFNPAPRDADLDQIVQEGTIWERPKGADIIYFTGRVWDQTGNAPLRSDVRIVYNGREYKPGDASRFDSSSVGARLGVIGDRVTERIAQRPLSRDSAVGESLGTLGSDPAVGRTLGESRGTLDSAPTPTPEPDFGFADSDDVGLGPELDEWGLPVLPAGTVIPDPDDVFGRDDSDADPWGGFDDFARPAGEVVESSAKKSQKRRRDFWGRRKREKERQREEERVVPSMEEAVADEVEEEELDEIDAAIDKVEEAIEESFEVVEAPESPSIEVLVEEDIAEIRRLRSENYSAQQDALSREDKRDTIFPQRSKFRERGTKDANQISWGYNVDESDVVAYRNRLTVVLKREEYVARTRERISALTGIEFLDDGSIVYPEGGLDQIPRDVKLEVREIIRDFEGFEEPSLSEARENLDNLLGRLSVGGVFDADTAFWRFEVEYRRKLMTDPAEGITRTELAQIAGFSSWEEAKEAAVGDGNLRRFLESLELSARYGYNFFDDSVRDEATELAEALYKASNSRFFTRDNSLRSGVGNHIPRNVKSEDVEVVRQRLIESLDRVININRQPGTINDLSDEAIQILEERREVLADMTPEEFETLVLDYARQVMDDPDMRIGVMLSPEAAQGMGRRGRYLTTHSEQTDSRSKEYDTARVVYETGMLQMPLEKDTRAELAPSSGFLIPGARMRKARAEAEEQYFEKFGVPYDPADATPEQHAFFENARISQASVGIEAYADEVVVLKPSATAKSRFTDGDSFNEIAMTSLMQNPDGSPLSDQQLLNAIFGRARGTPELSIQRNEIGERSGSSMGRGSGGTSSTLGNFVVFAALGLDPSELGHSKLWRTASEEARQARKNGDPQAEILAIAKDFNGEMKRGEFFGVDSKPTAAYIETMTFGGFHTSEIESASEGVRDILDVAIPAEVQQRIESYSGQFLPTSAFVEENIEQATRSALNRAAAATGTDLPETGGTAKLLTARAGELPGKFVSTAKTMEIRADLKSRREVLLLLEADPDADPDAIAFAKNEIEILLQEAADMEQGKDIAVVAHTSSSDGWPSYLQVDHPSIVAQIHAATDKLSPEVRPEKVIVSFDAPYGGGMYVHGRGGVIYIHPAALDWKDASFNINQKDLATRLAKAGATSPEEFDAFFRPSQAWVDDIIIHEGFHRVDFLLAKAGKDPQAAASLLSSPEMAAAFDEWLTTSMPFLLEYFEGVDEADLRMHEFAYLGELLGVTGTNRDEAARRKLVQLYAARVKKPVDSVDPVVAEREERWRLISEVYAELARLDAKGIPFPNSEILIDGMTPAFSRIYEGSDGSGEVLRAAFADAAASLSDINDAVGSVQTGLDSVVRAVASDVSASVDDIDDAAEGVGLGVIRVRNGLHDHMDGYVPDPVTRDDIARQLGFADAGELDAATADDPVMANNARILEELASYGFSLERIDKISGEDWQARYEANTPNSSSTGWRSGSPLDDTRLDGIFSDIKARSEAEIKKLEKSNDPGKDQKIAWHKNFLEQYDALTFEERKQVVVAYMRDIFDDPDTTVAVSSDNVEDVYRDGIHKNIHFPGIKGSGGGGPGGPRSQTEAAIMGLHEQAPPELRPTYGYIVSGAQRRQARREALKNFSPVRYQTRKVEFFPGVTDEAKNEIVDTLMPEVLDELFPNAGVQKISELPNDADIETAVAALNDKIFERFGLLEYFTEDGEGRRRFPEWETGLLNIGFKGGVMVLDPKVLRRSSVSDGDSINNGGSPVPLGQDLTDQQLLDMVFKRSSSPKGVYIDPAIFQAAITGLDSTVLLRNLNGRRSDDEGKLLFPHQYLETQIFGNFQSAEIIAAKTGKGLDLDERVGVPNLPDLTPESEVAAIKAQRAAERAEQSIDAVAADAAATIEDLDDAGDEVVSFMARSSDDIDPNFGLPPGPDSPTEWDRERLSTADRLDGFNQPPTNISALDGEGLREDQQSLNRIVAEAATEEDLVPLQEALRQAVEDEGSPLYLEAERGSLSDEKTFKVIQALDDLIAFRSSSDESADQQQRVREAEEELAIQLRNAIGHHWGAARSEVFHWDFLSERVQTVLGDEFGVSIQHERRESPSDFESIRNLQEALTPFVDAWARSQYSATQQYLKENDITEVNLYRGLFIPRSKSSEVPRGTATDRGVPRARGLQSWTSSLDTALLFLGNKYETAKDEIKKIEDSGEGLGMPEHVLLHDVVPAQLIFGFASDAHKESFRFGISVEQEVVVLGGSSRRVNMLGDDFLDLHREPSGNFIIDRRESAFSLLEYEVFNYLSSDAEITQLDNLRSADELTGVDDLTASVERIQDQFGLQDLETRLDSGSRIFYDMETDLYFALDDSGDGPTEIQTFESFDDFVYSIDTSELEEQALQDWREGDAKRTVVFHGTTAEALETIRTEGLDPRSDTRGIVNRGVGDAVYTSETADVAEASYDVVVEIDLPRAIEDGVISVDSLDREPDVIRNEVLEGVASRFAVDDFVPEESIDGTRPDTVVISDRIPPEYLLVNGEPLVPQSVSANPDFGLPPGPDKLTGWDRDRLTDTTLLPRTPSDIGANAITGKHLRDDQTSLQSLVLAALNDDDDKILPAIESAVKAGIGESEISNKERSLFYRFQGGLDKLKELKAKDTSGFSPAQMNLHRAEIAIAKNDVVEGFANAMQSAWGAQRSELLHWDFVSERVQSVLGEEFGISVIHVPREPDAGTEATKKAQEALTPLVDAFIRGQYASTQQYLKDNGITEISVFRGLFRPNVVESSEISSKRESSTVVRGLESWTYDLDKGLEFAGNQFMTANPEIQALTADGSELVKPTNILLHDVIPAQLVFNIAMEGSEFGIESESEVVVLGNSRPIDIITNDILDRFVFQPDFIDPSDRIPNTSTDIALPIETLYDYLSGSDLPDNPLL